MITTPDKTVKKLTKGDKSEIYSMVESSMNIKLSDKGKKVIDSDVRRKMLQYDNNIDQVKSFFRNYHDEMKKLYHYGWEGYDKEALIYHLTK